MQQDCASVPDERAWQEIKQHAVETTERVEKRQDDLRELHAAVQDHLALLKVWESDTTRRLHAETERFVQQLQQREEELVQMVREDCALQRSQLGELLESLDSSEKQLAAEKPQLEDREWDVVGRAAAQRKLAGLLKQCDFFAVPDLHRYAVATSPVVAERHLTCVRELAPSLLPSALTIPIADNTVYLPLASSEKVGAPVEQRHASMMLPRGILYYIATAGHTKSFCNPVESNAVRVQCDAPVVLGQLSSLCDAGRPTRSTAAVPQHMPSLRTASQENARIELDFGDRRWVECTAYALRHGHAVEHAALRSWRLLGSRDRVRWVVLDEQRRNGMLGTSPFNVAAFTIDEEEVFSQVRHSWCPLPGLGCAFRYIALEIAGPDAVGKHHLELGGMELYGYLVDTLSL
ncbi:putative E3 ubiquitin-protein ligase HECTD1-like isoform X6 [Trypanosoma conorhini]|uniref:Putative E3 ubiquitin-protein ligase HECTD1-like isoform X6 n=1 Tax=Trypanosoma conorhini TaxID=83891 RepID=A0A3R7LYY4_9TRYP|nr:putative E3 ubiquitin-protein ligase HECTD1-like isoform X6 [Trypanosoma conorhini]RNF23387.1 putative E3 ubiquitin-protein ligase HECTD1-like isoform X6 [Trypanosoma conorhini]